MADLDIDSVLASHRWEFATFQQRVEMVCTCGEPLLPPLSSAVATLADFRAHLDKKIREHLAAWLESPDALDILMDHKQVQSGMAALAEKVRT